MYTSFGLTYVQQAPIMGNYTVYALQIWYTVQRTNSICWLNPLSCRLCGS